MLSKLIIIPGTDKLTKCQDYSCALEQLRQKNDKMRRSLDTDQYIGLTESKSPKPFTEYDLKEFIAEYRNFCRKTTGDLSDMVFGLKTSVDQSGVAYYLKPKQETTKPKKKKRRS